MKTFKLISKAFIGLCCLFATEKGFTQNVGISATSGFTPDASAGLDISYTNKGLLVPRVALTATNAAGPVTSPAVSLLVYNTATAGTAPNNVVPGYYYWNGVAWTALNTGTTSANSSWATIGNTGTTAGTNFIGTTDAVDFVFKTNNAERARFTSGGNFGIGSTAFNATNPEQLLVDAGASSFNVISGKGNLNNYLQLNIQNINAGTAASSDVVATADNGNETTNYVDMGINSSANTSAYFGAANDAYLYNAGGSTGGNFFIGTSSSGKSLGFLTGGGATTNERMRIDGTSGNVGIGTITPAQKLDITGNLKLSGAFMPGNNAGTAGYFLVSSGASAAPIWYNATSYINTAAWVLAGNPGTNPATSFIGTTDAQDFVVRTNNAERARVTSAGSFGIGSTAFNSTNPEKLLVDAGASSFNVISGKGNLNNYLQLNIQNINAGTAASSDVVATADNGNETTNYVDMGINSSANTSAYFGAANDAYLYNAGGSTGGNFFIGTSSSGKSLGFLTGGGATTNERMRIDGTSGNVGIGTITPSTKLHVFGANPLTLSGVVTGTNTTADSLLTITSGLVRKLPMSTFASSTGSWSTLGNAGTNAGTNFIGTTDAQDMVFKANNVERMRIVNGTSSATGTTGDITIGDATSGTLRSAKELVLRQDGDVYGQSTLRLRNRAGQNGAVFETTGGSANLVDFIFNTGAVASPISSNIRFETRSGNMKVTGNTTEWQFGQPDVVNGGPTLVVGAAGTASNSSFLTGRVGIGNNAPTEKLDVTGNLKFSGALMPNNNAGTAGYILQSAGSGAAPVWVSPASNSSWSLTGNAGTTAGTNFIGTTDAVDFVAKTNNAERLRISSAGDVAIGGTAFNGTNPEQLLVDAGTTTSTNVISGKGRINSFLQLNIQNLSTGNSASSDVVATADNGTDAVNYVDMGINGSGNNGTFYYGTANDAYLYNVGGSTGGNFYIGTSTSGKILGFLTGGTAASNERMRIDGTGNVGIGTTTPSQKLDVNGSINAANSIYLDAANTNTGSQSPGLIFGGPTSGETIISKRTAGTNQYGIDFYTASNDRMTIASGGNVGIGTTTPTYKLTVAGIVAPSADGAYSLGGGTTNRWTTVYTTNGVSQTSDRRLKTNIKNLNYGLKEVLALNPVSYNWKEKPDSNPKIGLIAQDVRKLVPEVVIGDEAKENLGMNYAELIPVLINAIKEQQKEIDDLKKAVQKLQK